ncbi:hypothetical protein GCM10010412_100650 [Nonomuraea recticatena]|uniref:Uncharacterized protein n=1 Tax=Nonomuraea recticatena TaxID=46178 RepID=A0ABN3TIT7_9ACTN
MEAVPGAGEGNETVTGQWRGDNPQLTEMMNAFRGVRVIRRSECRSTDLGAKGLMGRPRGIVKTCGSIWAGPGR